MLKSVERLLEFVGDMNATEINDHIKGRLDGIAVSFGIDGEWLDGWNRAVLATVEKIEKEVAERYVELPKDANGVPIRVGDVLTDGEYTFVVDQLAVFGDGSWSIRNEDGNAWAACDVTHHHEPTVEDVLYESLKHFGAVEERTPEVEEWLHEQAAKLRLAGDAE